MLSSVLPGLRELRAPVAAGFLWLVAFWFCFEARLTDDALTSGALGAAVRLEGILESIGLGATLSFGAYLIGSLSVFALSVPLRRVMRTSDHPRGGWRDTLSPGAWQAVQLVASEAAGRLNRVLSLSGIDIDQAIDRWRPDPHVTTSQSPLSSWLAKRCRAREAGGWRADAFVHPSERHKQRLARLVISDLPAIASTRLLGKHPDVFSAIDRSRAEVEFRLAVAPPVLGLSASIACREAPGPGPVVLLVGSALAAGIVLDAIRQQRRSNDLILDLLQVNEITSPSLEQLEAWAADFADRSPSNVLARHGRRISEALQPLFKWIKWGMLSAPADALTDGFDSLATAHKELHELSAHDVPKGVIETGTRLLQRVSRIVRAWAEFNPGAVENPGAMPTWDDGEAPINLNDPDVLIAEKDRARKELIEFGDQLQDAIVAAATREAARQSVTSQ